MSVEPTPQEALLIAATSRERARQSSAVPGWAPPVAGLSGGSGIGLLYLGLFGPRIDPAPFAAGIALTLLSLGLASWLSRSWRNAGVMPRRRTDEPVQRWKQIATFAVPVGLAVAVGQYLGSHAGALRWMCLPLGLLFGCWLWFALARQRAATWRS
ncbi:hypothetical protein [Nocardia cyriacigeorgica]|uniref:hypothetical protein n=1 Tax=Nocardia cyriacigeorgica TaxID=135487 RepID=UPI0018952DA4|nr:hypothetical protein [Nocardia cyriacigeorgica]MBF6414358.1 hypothetical protein [Nocardia cyriacigeorgica]